MAKIVCIVPRREMADQASLLAANMHIDDFSVIFAETEEIPTLAKSLAGVGIDVIIARGAQALMLRELCDIPIVEIRITAQEMGLLIRRSKSILNIPEPKIGVIGHVNMFCDMSSFDYLYGIKLHTYYADVTSDLSALAEAACSDGMDILLGGDAVCQTASMHSVPSLFLTSGTESLSEAMRNAKNVAYACDLEKNNTAEVKALLDYSFSGIIKLDRDGHILRMNHLAEKILGGRESEFLGSKMADVVPAFSSAITDVLGGEDVYSAVYSVRDTPVVINMAPIIVDGRVDGSILSFHESSTISRMETQVQRDRYRREQPASSFTFQDFRSRSRSFAEVINQAKRFADYSAPIFLCSPSLDEAELLAQAIHNSSGMSSGPFISINCSSFDSAGMDLALFSSRSGLADLASGGTLFISQIEKLSDTSQYKLARLAKDGVLLHCSDPHPVLSAVRLITASSCDLSRLTAEGRFREDLFYAATVLSIKIPRLNERREDILPIAEIFLQKFREKYSRYVYLTGPAKQLIENFDWVGNTAQLESFCENVVLSSYRQNADDILVRRLLSQYSLLTSPPVETVTVYRAPEAAELESALKENRGNRQLTAKQLGISTSTLWRRMKKYGIS